MRNILFLFMALFISACNTVEKLEEKVFVVNIKQGEENLKDYLAYHSKVWPEVEQGFKLAGYRKIQLLHSKHTIVMIITVPQGADLQAMGKKAESFHPRCAEWNRLMSTYQEGVAGTAAGQTWTEVRPFYLFGNK